MTTRPGRLRMATLMFGTGLASLALVVTARSARHGADVREGGTLRIASSEDVDSLDPALAAGEGGSFLVLDATCAPLFTQPDIRGPGRYKLRPEAASAFPRLSRDGRTYTFTVRRDLRFSDGRPLLAVNFARALERLLAPAMGSPYFAPYFTDLVGADAVAKGRATRISGIRARGRTLSLRLERPAPDIVARLAAVCPVPANLPTVRVERVPGSGPYYVAERVPGRRIVLRRNRFYRGPRPRHVAVIEQTVGRTREANIRRVERGEIDYQVDGVPPEVREELARKYGVGRSQFFTSPTGSLAFLAMNTSRPLFRNNVRLRRAVNFALDRAHVLRQGGFFAGKRTDQVIAPPIPGFRDVNVYPLKGPNLRVARRLAKGRTRGGRAVLYTWNTPAIVKRAEVIRYNLSKIGLNVEIRSFSRPVHIVRTGTRGEPFDLSLGFWIADYLDPNQFVGVLLNGNTIRATENTNISYFDDPQVNRKIEAAARLPAPARYGAFARLDEEIMRRYAPMAPLSSGIDYHFVSRRVGCLVPFDYPAWCLKR